MLNIDIGKLFLNCSRRFRHVSIFEKIGVGLPEDPILVQSKSAPAYYATQENVSLPDLLQILHLPHHRRQRP